MILLQHQQALFAMVRLIIRSLRRLISISTLLQQVKRYYGQFHVMHLVILVTVMF